ncbi:hypothetical protein [Azohydromonas aeria]|uniref:hypothetical protein n=1 Tax=Azohydromonas aeria TaxID=2590212 RepID=UPI0012FB7149|nr:hypothetical protein [Azohydromonas aeria]
MHTTAPQSQAAHYAGHAPLDITDDVRRALEWHAAAFGDVTPVEDIKIEAAHYDAAAGLLAVTGRKPDGQPLEVRAAYWLPLDMGFGDQAIALAEFAAQAVAEAVTEFCPLPAVSQEPAMSNPWFRNHYRHDECPEEPGVEWSDEWDCMCNDECPACGTKDIEPHDSDDLSDAAQALAD